MKSILDPTFVYTPAASTDLRKTFARIRREMHREMKRAREREEAAARGNVQPLFARKEEKP